MRAAGTTLRLGKQKNGLKNVCIYQDASRDKQDCPVREVGRQYCHVRANTEDASTLLLAYFVNVQRKDVIDDNI